MAGIAAACSAAVGGGVGQVTEYLDAECTHHICICLWMPQRTCATMCSYL